MKRVLVVVMAATVFAGVTGCAAARVHADPQSLRIAIPADKPPSPATWPKYPHFSQHSCWGRPFQKGVVPVTLQVAPSYAPKRRAHPTPPAEIIRRFLARFGDRRYLHSITLGPPPPATGANVHVLYAGGHPPADALQATIVAPKANIRHEGTHPADRLANGIASWETELVSGALRDDFCTAGGAPLIWIGGDATGIANDVFALGQRFPNPSPASFRHRVALVGKRFGFQVVSLRLLRPEQIAPLLVVKTSRGRQQFAHDVTRIMALLNPTSSTPHRGAFTFEGFFFAAEDAHGRPFLYTQGVNRGEGEGGEWAANRCLYPYPTEGLVIPNSRLKKCS